MRLEYKFYTYFRSYSTLTSKRQNKKTKTRWTERNLTLLGSMFKEFTRGPFYGLTIKTLEVHRTFVSGREKKEGDDSLSPEGFIKIYPEL